MVHIKWIVSVVSGVVLIGVGFVSFLGVSNLNDIGEQLAQNAKAQVRNAIETENGNVTSIDNLTKVLQGAKNQYEQNKGYIKSLNVLNNLKDINRDDPYFAYEKLEQMEYEESTPASRKTALELFANVIESGERGIADPNTLFNASVSAERMGFHLEAVKLAVLADHWQPTLSHKAVRAQATGLLGHSFELVGGRLQQVELSPKDVRRLSWQDMLDMVELAPRVECEHIYSRASNIARRNRGDGYFRQLIDTILKSETMHPGELTSYAYSTLAEIYAWQGEEGWREKYIDATTKSLQLLAKESPDSTWYDHSVGDSVGTAGRLGKLSELLALADSVGVSSDLFLAYMGEDLELTSSTISK